MAVHTSIRKLRSPHRHEPVIRVVVVQRAGIPYELERTVCATCSQVLSEHPVRRAAA
jgi:hypothetical protein